MTTSACPMITDLTSYHTFPETWMFTIKPAWSVSTAASHGYTFLWNLVTTVSRHTIPLWYQYVIRSSSIALNPTLVRVTHCTISLVKFLVAANRTFRGLSCKVTMIYSKFTLKLGEGKWKKSNFASESVKDCSITWLFIHDITSHFPCEFWAQEAKYSPQYRSEHAGGFCSSYK